MGEVSEDFCWKNENGIDTRKKREKQPEEALYTPGQRNLVTACSGTHDK